jgi:hypothetical protein
MSEPIYHALSRRHLDFLHAPGNADLARAWESLSGALHGLVAVLSNTHPRPFYFYEALDRRALVEQPNRLKGSPLYDIARTNVHAAEEIETMAREEGNSREVQEVVDRYLDALLDEYDAIRLYPEPPLHRRTEEAGVFAGQSATAGH